MRKLQKVTLKSSLFANSCFWLLLLSEEGFDVDILIFVLLGIIVICMICFFTLLFTIYPFYTKFKNNLTDSEIFYKCFPIYATIAFFLCLLGAFEFDMDPIPLGFFVIAFTTSSLSWVWYCTPFKTTD